MESDVSDAGQFREEGRFLVHGSVFRVAAFAALSTAKCQPFGGFLLHAHRALFIQKRNEAASRKSSP
jgi:hypothetical protein